MKTVRLTAPAGTDVIFGIAGRAFIDDITIAPGHPGNLPAGEVWCAPLERSMNGTIVCDGSIGDLGQVQEPLVIGVENGRVVTMKSADTVLVERVWQLMGVDDEASLAGEFGIGLNPKARLTGLLLEDEKAYGTVHIAFGGNTGHAGRPERELHPPRFPDQEPVDHPAGDRRIRHARRPIGCLRHCKVNKRRWMPHCVF